MTCAAQNRHTLMAPLALPGAVPVTHDIAYVNAAYQGILQDTQRLFAGHTGSQSDTAAYPGMLTIEPGDNWSNYVGASAAGIGYSIKHVVLQVDTPSILQCADWFPARRIAQTGTENIRLNWPLLYAIPGRTWTLTILYGTPVPWDDDASGPNPESLTHVEVWQWQVDADIRSMMRHLEVLRDLPDALSGGPLISSETLYSGLLAKLVAARDAYDAMDYTSANLMMGEFEMEVVDGAIAVVPLQPHPGGPGTGILNTPETPAACSLLADAEHFGMVFV